MVASELIDPELLSLLEILPEHTLSAETLPIIRAQMDANMGALHLPMPDGVTTEERRARSVEGHDVGLVISRPAKASPTPRPAVLHIHGGGYILGSAAIMNGANQQLALDADCVVVSVDYRLAPETPHPGPIEDCYVGLKWLHDNVMELGVDPARIAISGESAGGGLAAALALLARDRGEVKIIHQHLIYPMIDDRTCMPANTHPFTGQVVWKRDANHFGWSSLLGHEPGLDDVSPYAAAARAKDLAGLPGTFISTGALDLFCEEDIEYARRLTHAGVATELHVYPGAYHGFDLAPDAFIAKRARENSFAAFYRALHPVR